MKTVANIIWFIPGLLLAVGYVASGVAMCVTIIGIPFGLQSFKFVPLALFPFGKEIVMLRCDEAAAHGPTATQSSP